jgi:hypothetical protein
MKFTTCFNIKTQSISHSVMASVINYTYSLPSHYSLHISHNIWARVIQFSKQTATVSVLVWYHTAPHPTWTDTTLHCFKNLHTFYGSTESTYVQNEWCTESGNTVIHVYNRQLWYSVCFIWGVNIISKYYPTTLTEVFPCFLPSCKANVRVKLAKTGHGPHFQFFFFFLSLLCMFRSLYSV